MKPLIIINSFKTVLEDVNNNCQWTEEEKAKLAEIKTRRLKKTA